jgi:hypothetical protein
MNVGLAQRAAGALCLYLLLHLPPAGADSQHTLALMKDKYNEARHVQGLEPIK